MKYEGGDVEGEGNKWWGNIYREIDN